MTITQYQNWLRPHHRHFFSDNQDAHAWTPRVDVREEDARYVIFADIPGVDSKDIEISMDKGVLTIKGERKSESASENGKLTRVERRYGAFERSFVLPDSADADAITASGKNGVLEVAIPKKAQAAPRKIAVN
ncbi:MAG: Hsp20/alpha crystallin family protein [Rudaea sp.]|uniref:Hsp20 family protein n=1 Tax=unclassified Rudaea TaxID=2627037 RepID=UPI0010F6B026|nr:Hsp20/alpha crystallin family protein [Rudaea sp.]MBR0343856.1 Hsp20/alpha crystallin family protein [Rudaea sp.]